MKKGDKGQSVFNLQSDLSALGFPVGIDGMYGPQTFAAVKAFQNKYSLRPDGVAGPVTLAKLAEVKGQLPPGPQPAPGPKPTPEGTVRGIDVSNYQVNTDWAKVAASGIGFAFIKVTEGLGYVSPEFKRDYAEAKAHGLVVGTYHFFHPNMDAVAQAKFYAGHLLGTIQPDDLPPCLDLEQTNGATPAKVLSQSLLFLREMRSAFNKQPILYTMPDMINQLGHPESLHEFPLWIAGPGRTTAPMVQPWNNDWLVWQNSFKTAVPGVNGADDTDIFNGSMEQLKAFAAKTLPIATPVT